MRTDRQYVYAPTKAVNGGAVVVGSLYSLLTWVAERTNTYLSNASCGRQKSEEPPGEAPSLQIVNDTLLATEHSSHTEHMPLLSRDEPNNSKRLVAD